MSVLPIHVWYYDINHAYDRDVAHVRVYVHILIYDNDVVFDLRVLQPKNKNYIL